MESALAIANHFVDKAYDTESALTPMKLVKLVYIAHGWHLALFDEPLIREKICAWKYGPVVKEVYDEFKKFGQSQVASFYSEDTPNGKKILRPSDEKQDFLDRIWDVYGQFDGIRLSSLTHQKGTPWDLAVNKSILNWGGLRRNLEISTESIREHYKTLIKDNG